MREVFTWRFSPGDRVRLRYGARRGRDWIGRHLQEGVVLVAPCPGKGPVQRRVDGADHPVRRSSGPRNYLVALDTEHVVVPAGNMRKLVRCDYV